jgi:hypothetical protein
LFAEIKQEANKSQYDLENLKRRIKLSSPIHLHQAILYTRIRILRIAGHLKRIITRTRQIKNVIFCGMICRIFIISEFS